MNFKEFILNESKNDLASQFSDRAPEGMGKTGARAVADVVTDVIPGAGTVRAGVGFLWNILSNRRQRSDFTQVMERVKQHKEWLKYVGKNPERVFWMDDSLAAVLSDEAISEIMSRTLAYLDKFVRNRYKGMQDDVVATVAFKYLKKHMENIRSQVKGDYPVAQPANYVTPITQALA